MVPLALTLVVATNNIAVKNANCANPNVAASVSDVLFDGVPSIAAASDEHGVTKLRVTLSSNAGFPKKVSIESSSGLLAVDSVAMREAKNTIFTPEIQNCSAIAGEYFYEVET
jgi:outer membrane biosynthesis protein TonB